MPTFRPSFRRADRARSPILSCLFAALCLATAGAAAQAAAPGFPVEGAARASAAAEQSNRADINVVDVISTGRNFHAPDQIPSGWTTFGIQVDQDIRPGRHTIAVHFKDQIVHGHFLGHDVHLVRLQDDTDMAALATWMDWTQPTGLEAPAPAEFLGGVNDMPAGSTGYMSVVLTPGRYAWIAEVPDPAGKNMLKTFTVPFGNHAGH